MLAIGRKSGESIIIELDGGQTRLEIKVVEIGNQVRLGISAPESCKIWREEIYQTVLANRQANSVPADFRKEAAVLSERLGG